MLCHIFSVYLPTVEINVEVIEDNTPLEEEEEEEEEFSLGETSEEEESDVELAAVVAILNTSRRE